MTQPSEQSVATHVPSDLVQGLTQQYAQERAAITSQLKPGLPKNVLQINSCEVMYTIQPRMLPYRNVPFDRLASLLEEHYSLRFRFPDLRKLGAVPPDQLKSLSSDQVGNLILQSPEPDLDFSDGLLKLPDGSAIAIISMHLARERVLVQVDGPTEAAERVIIEVVPLIWALLGVRRDWPAIAPYHQVASYGTDTRVRLPNAALPLLSDNFVSLLRNWTAQGGLATNMGGRTALEDFTPPSGSTVTFTLDELHMLFHCQRSTGTSETSKLRIGVDARSERGTGVVSIATELPFTEHIKLVGDLIAIGSS